MLNKFTISFAYVALLCVSVFAQNEQIASVFHDVHNIDSKILNEKRSIWVRTPLNYQRTGDKFPVVYMLDGHTPQPSMMAGIIEQQSWGGKMPEMILVSIQNTNRTRDLTPTDDGGKGEVGGGDKFLQFVEKEIMPLVEKNYRTQPFKIFAGHSFGGLTVVYSLATRPDLFDAYIAASPVLQYDKDFVIKETEKLFEQNRELKKTIFLGLGDEPNFNKGWNKFQKLLKNNKPKKFEFEFQDYQEDTHASVILPVYYDGLRMIFKGWSPKNAKTLADLENHYDKLSKRFGYEILIPEAMLNAAAYQLLNQKKYTEAIKLFKQNTENYPNSPNVFDSLGEAFEKNGKMKLAQENYQKGYDLAIKIGDGTSAAFIKTNLDRVSAKVK